MKSEYKECVEALRIETEGRTKAESTCKVLKEIIETDEETSEIDDQEMEVDNALGVWLTQQKRKPVKRNSKRFNCGKCVKIFINEKDLIVHASEHEKELHVCQICDKSFENDESFHIHKEEHVNTVVRTLIIQNS